VGVDVEKPFVAYQTGGIEGDNVPVLMGLRPKQAAGSRWSQVVPGARKLWIVANSGGTGRALVEAFLFTIADVT